MDFNTLEIIGLAFLSGLKVAEIAEDIMEEDTEEETKNEGKHSKEEKDADITIEVGKLEGDKAKEFMNFIKKITREEE